MQRGKSVGVAALVAGVIGSAFGGGLTFAAPFTPGNFVNYRIGNPGVSTLSNAVPVFIDEYTPTGGLVQSVAMPSSGTASGVQTLVSSTSTTEGNISLSGDGNYVVISGYRRDAGGTTAPNSDTSAATPRVVGRVAMNGTFDTSTALTDAFSAGNFRSIGSDDGTHFWIGGSSGVRYVASVGATTSTAVNGNNVRAEVVAGGSLFESTGVAVGSLPKGIRTYNGLPTGAGTPTQIVSAAATPANDSYQGLVLFDESPSVAGVDTLYTTRLDTVPAAQQGYIAKYVKQADGSWVAAGESASVTNLFYLSGAYDPVTGRATLYGSTFDNNTLAKLVTLTDSTGFGGSLTSSMVPSTIVTGISGEGFRGVAVVPVPEPTGLGLLAVGGLAILRRRRR